MPLRCLVDEVTAPAPKLRGRLVANAAIAEATWFRVGGPAEALFSPADEDDLAYLLSALPPEIPVTTIGLGSNLIVRDDAAIVLDLDSAEGPAAEPDDEAGYSAVAHDEVRAEADRRDRDPGRQGGEEIGEIILVGRGKKRLSRTADPEPGRLRDRSVGDEASAQLGRQRLHLVDKSRLQSHRLGPL